MGDRDSLTCISNTGSSLGGCWLAGEPNQREGQRGTCLLNLHQTARLSSFLHKRQREGKENAVIPAPLLKKKKKQQITSEVFWRMEGQLKDSL